jgi:hypothetical protein
MQDSEDDVRPEVEQAMDKVYKSENCFVKTILSKADQHGYSEFDRFVMLSALLAEQNQALLNQVIELRMAVPLQYQVVTQEEYDELVLAGLVNPITKRGL